MSVEATNVFLTGATGVVGAEVLRRLIERPETSVTALVRNSASGQEAEERVKSLLESLGYRDFEVFNRVRPVTGDITKHDLGLDASTLTEIKSTCTHFVHCAGKVKLSQSIEEARRHSVTPAKSVIELASASDRLQKVEFVSTIGVAGKLEGEVPEERLCGVNKYHNTYEQSKAEAEVLCFNAIDNGLPMSIHRPSMVVGDSCTGQVSQYQVFYHLCDFLSGRRTCGVLPRFGTQMVDIVPVNYVADCIVDSLFTTASVGKIFHLCNGPSPDLEMEKLRNTVQRIYGEFEVDCIDRLRLPKWVLLTAAWLGKNLGPKHIRGSARALPHLLAYLGRNQVFRSNETQRWMESRGIRRPDPIDYVDRIIRRYIQDSQAPTHKEAENASSVESHVKHATGGASVTAPASEEMVTST
ncbi:hypothetical protein CKO51_05240 [Rhodopirellula sp. SM50]|nr:SDR family oxidoreductase [Rhodopirellula sp. SM50]PAY20623.1 hypothetical protein CKO51_05240 [Rhodopirellula sp. SM50]